MKRLLFVLMAVLGIQANAAEITEPLALSAPVETIVVAGEVLEIGTVPTVEALEAVIVDGDDNSTDGRTSWSGGKKRDGGDPSTDGENV